SGDHEPEAVPATTESKGTGEIIDCARPFDWQGQQSPAPEDGDRLSLAPLPNACSMMSLRTGSHALFPGAITSKWELSSTEITCTASFPAASAYFAAPAGVSTPTATRYCGTPSGNSSMGEPWA